MLARLGPDGLLTAQSLSVRPAIGRAGITNRKQEGDGATPTGVLPLRRVLYRADRIPPFPCAVPRSPLAPTDGWCDDPTDPAYNRPVTHPYAASYEQLWRADPLYDVIGVLGWNDAPVIQHRGSAIFLHIATLDFAPTAGCIALKLSDLLALLAAGLTEIEVASR